MRISPLYPLLAASLILFGCAGGGGGSGSSPAVTTSPFTSWSAIQPNTNVQANGGSTQVTYTANPTTGAVGTIANNGIANQGAWVSLTYGSGNLNLTAISLTSAQGQNVNVSTYAGDSITTIGSGPVPSTVYGITKDRTTEVLAINATAYAWDYQTYGVWITGEGTGSGTAGAVTAGSATPVTGIPATGTAVFYGNALGVYGIAGLPAYSTAASMSANANFGSRSIAFATSGTVMASFNGGNVMSAPGLNMSGNLTYAAGSNQFSGSVRSSSGMTGSAAGQFYGPNANEIGGTYNLTGSGFMGGGFGGKR